MDNAILDAALEYAARGWSVIPISKHKQPLIEWKDATREELTNPNNIRSWWEKYPAANVAIVTGSRSGGLVVIDLDVDDEKGVDGEESLREWCDENDVYPIESDATVETGRGGKHLYFTSANTYHNQVGCLDGVDVRGEGGCIVAPPSVHGSTRRTYFWDTLQDDIIVPQADSDVVFFLASMEARNNSSNGEYVKNDFTEITSEGGRNNKLFKYVSRLQGDGETDQVIREYADLYNRTHLNPPLDDVEVERTVNSVLSHQSWKGTAAKSQKTEVTKVTEENGTTVYKSERTGKNGRKIVEEFTSEDLEMPTLDTIEETEKEWLIPGWIPKGCVTLLCSDGGIGKTSIWCSLVADLTAGRPTIFDKSGGPDDLFPDNIGKHNVMYFSKEDSTKSVLKAKIRKAHGDETRIHCFTLDDSRINKVWYGSEFLEALIKKYKPEICVFDTLQTFLPESVDMAKRKDMRDALDPLNQMGAKYGTSFLLIMHTNKSSLSGRQRMADSSDIWDLGRSAIMAGRTKDNNIRYLSQEKCNYGELQETILFSITDNGVVFKGLTKKKDRDFMNERQYDVSSPKLDEAKEFIIEYLEQSRSEQTWKSIADGAAAAGIAKSTAEEARAVLVKERKIVKHQRIGEKDKTMYSLPQIQNNQK